MSLSKREVWVDYTKVFACILVVLGHFFQSMVKANILPENDIYTWFNTTIYYFHVPLFYICSGYLYQRYSKVDSWGSWKNNVLKKALVLGVPYFVFSFAIWLLKTLFSGSVNDEIGGLAETLFLQPTPPYWYMYVLLLIFLVTPTMRKKTSVLILICVSVLLKILYIFREDTVVMQIYPISRICQNEIWFALGMLISFIGIKKLNRRCLGMILGAAFIGLSTAVYRLENGFVSWGMGILACGAVILIISSFNENDILDRISGYTLPIFLMHTLFAATARAMLLKLSVGSPVVHVTVGIVISFIGPIVAMLLLEKIKLSWIVYPGRLLKKKRSQ